MNIRNVILKEHSKTQTIKIFNYVGESKERFAELVKLFFCDDPFVVHRAAWSISYCGIEHPKLVKPYLGKFIALLSKPNLHPAVYRNILRTLQFIEVPKKYLGTLTNSCFDLLMNANSPIAVRVFAMTVLLNITKREPELKRELRIVIEEVLKEARGGIKARGQKVLKELSNEN